jgi:NAD(P)H-quinone oxidoreductase subunit 5
VVVLAVGSALGLAGDGAPASNAAALILALALAPLFLRGAGGDARTALGRAAAAVGLAMLYAAGHAAFGAVAPTVAAPPLQGALRLGGVAAAFVTLYAVQAAIAVRPAGRLARALYPACFAGFYLDELCTRLTFRVWPPSAAPAPAVVRPSPAPVLRELPA